MKVDFMPGDVVTIVETGERAKVTKLCIEGHGHVTYEIIWHVNGTRQSAWVQTFEVVPLEKKRSNCMIGYT